MMGNRAIGLYSIGLGLAVIALWTMILASGPLPEGPRELAFHLASELIMALGCIASGVFLLRNHRLSGAANATAHAMVVYSTLNAAGYYLERGAAGATAAMTLLALLSALIVLRQLSRA